MAMADYRLCDVCGCKTFYDSNLNYEFLTDGSGNVRNGGEVDIGLGLERLGDWCVICNECSKTHKCIITPTDPDKEQP